MHTEPWVSKGLGSLQPHFRAMFGTPCSLGMWQRWFWMPLVGKGPEKESPTCGVCCVGRGVRGLSPLSPWGPPGSRAWATSPGSTGEFLTVGIPTAGLFSGFFSSWYLPLWWQPLLSRSSSPICWTEQARASSCLVLHPASHLNSN